MWEDLLAGLLANLTPSHLVTLFIGTLAGTFIGALPGLSSISAVALMLPFTFTMEPGQGLVMLAAVYMSAEFGGSIPAILIGTPGTSGASVTMLDGYPLTKKGQAQEALFLQLFAGVVGGTLGALTLIFFTPVLARWSLLLGPPEYFWLAIAGLALVASLAGRNVYGALIGVVLGILLTVPGQDLTTGQLRYTFGSPDMVGGLPMVPALLGLFAVASVLTLLEQKTEAVAPLRRRPGVIRYVLKRMWGMKKVLAWTSAVGTIIGIIPGVGNAASAFVAYSEGKRISKHPEEFGKGSWEGVAAPETANNAVVGGSLVTLLGLGIPGSPAAAIMYGALTVHGILAGPRLFEQRADVAYTFTTGLILTVVAMLIFGLLTVRYLALIVRVPVRFIIPAVLSLTLIGTFGLRNNIFDVAVVVAVGAMGFVLQKVGVTWVPIALGLILGHIAEANFQRSLLIAQTRGGNLFVYWFTRPVTVLLALIVVMMLVSGIRQVIKAERLSASDYLREQVDRETAIVQTALREGEDADAEDEGARSTEATTKTTVEQDAEPEDDGVREADEAETKRRWVTQRHANIVLASGLLLVAFYVYYDALTYMPRAAFLPNLVAALLFLLALPLLIINVVPKLGKKRELIFPFGGVPWLRWLGLVSGLVIVAWAARHVGFYESIFVYLLLATFMLSKVRLPFARAAVHAVAFSVGFTTFLYLAFQIVLNVPTPSGILL